MATRRKAAEVECSIASHLELAQRAEECLIARNHNTRRILDRRTERGLLLSPAPGCYVSPGYWESLGAVDRSLHVMRAIQRKNPSLVFCGPSSAVAWGLYKPASYITRPYVATSRLNHVASSMRLQRICLPDDLDIELCRGVRVTGLIRTAFDAARMLGFRRGLGVCDRALAEGGLSAAELFSQFKGMRRTWGCGVARSCATHADALAENGGESYARAAMIELGFARPLLQVPVADPMGEGRPYRLDYLWIPEELDAEKILHGLATGALGPGEAAGCVAGELDGRDKTFDERLAGGRDAQDRLLAERRREARLTYYGLRVVRFSFAEVQDDAYLERLLSSYGVPRA